MPGAENPRAFFYGRPMTAFKEGDPTNIARLSGRLERQDVAHQAAEVSAKLPAEMAVQLMREQDIFLPRAGADIVDRQRVSVACPPV